MLGTLYIFDIDVSREISSSNKQFLEYIISGMIVWLLLFSEYDNKYWISYWDAD